MIWQYQYKQSFPISSHLVLSFLTLLVWFAFLVDKVKFCYECLDAKGLMIGKDKNKPVVFC